MLDGELVKLGLTAGEARVFLSLLRLGSVKVGEIVKDSKVSYSKIYDVLERLGSKGLVSHVFIGNTRYFNAVEPFRLHDYIQKKEDNLRIQKDLINKIIPSLVKVADNNRRNSAEIFSGERGLRTAYEILFKGASRNDILRYFYPFEDYHPVASPFYSRLYLFQKQMNLDERGISTINFKKSKHYKEIPKTINMRFVSFPLPGTMDIFGDKLLMISWANTTGILVSSKEITDHFKDYFDSIWQIADR